MTAHVADQAAAWVYRGVWAGLVRWLRVPPDPPTLPVHPGETARSFRPAQGFLRCLKFWFWLALLPIDILIMGVWLVIFIAAPVVGVVLLGPALFLAIAPDILAYVAIHVRYDTTWYVLTNRSMRLRRGVWIIQEVTVTFENVQNVRVQQGPIQRLFGIADVVVEAAGGGGGGGGPHGHSSSSGHHAIIQGVDNAGEIRDLIMARLRSSRSAGLGDEEESSRRAAPGWTAEHVAALREILAEVRLTPA